MYENVIVPFDGSLPGRAALAPAGDLAWRCGARVVIVTNTAASESESRDALKSKAMSLSGADVDFWVDTNASLARAVLDAAAHRANPIVVVSGKVRSSGLRRARAGLPALAEEVLAEATCPVMIVGPTADVSRGLPMTELVVALDGSSSAEEVLPMAAEWCRDLRLRMVLLGVVSAAKEGPHQAELDYLESHRAAVASIVPEVQAELVTAVDPGSGIVAFLGEHEDAVLAMSTHGRSGRQRGPLGAVANQVVASSPRVVVVRRPGI
jgi:nucleotide-binding universal stress UspA family protein